LPVIRIYDVAKRGNREIRHQYHSERARPAEVGKDKSILRVEVLTRRRHNGQVPLTEPATPRTFQRMEPVAPRARRKKRR
jgi:hypothetical protein